MRDVDVSDSEWRWERLRCVRIEKRMGSTEVVKRREVKIDEGLVLEDISEKGNLSSGTVLTSRKAERLRRSDQARFPQEGQDRMSHIFCVGGS